MYHTIRNKKKHLFLKIGLTYNYYYKQTLALWNANKSDALLYLSCIYVQVNTLWGSFEVSIVRLCEVMLQQFSGAPLPQDPTTFNTLASQFSTLPLHFLTYHGQQSATSVLKVIIFWYFSLGKKLWKKLWIKDCIV